MAPASPAHKPRKKRKGDSAILARTNKGTVYLDPNGNVTKPAFPLVAFLWPAIGNVSQWLVLPLILMAVGLFRWSTAFWGYSGFQKPPMHGDFEAQRHWLEITANLPITQWYFHDLQWWGLDYPPLTAYHSWLLGKIGNYIEPAWFALHTSRGLDDPNLKIFMRATALASEYLVYVPAVIFCLRRYARVQEVNTWEFAIALVAVLMQPATILIDHGHFQYNTVMLGFVAATMYSLIAGRYFWSCVFFVAALGFKQMALFYAPAVFAYLLGSCLFPRVNILRFIGIALVTVASFGLLYAPLILGTVNDWYNGLPISNLPEPELLSKLPISLDKESWYYAVILEVAQSVHRIFPFARGLFEDKVANVWCAIHTFHKLHKYPTADLQFASLVLTGAHIATPCLVLFFKPRKELLPYAFASTSWAFFLFSYQVHEKNVMLPLLPMTLLLGSSTGLSPYVRAWVGLANMLGAWTMYPLLKRDELSVPYYVLTLLWAYLLGLPPTSLSIFRSNVPSQQLNALEKLIHAGFYAAMIFWHFLDAFVPTPGDKPDLWVVANVLTGAPGFYICWLWCLYNLIDVFKRIWKIERSKKMQ
ncbi:dolichyl pyrophosphate Man9GlcNAc2 alpha-1,3-glucosyltransferase-like protein [Phyllosticta capitalensis]